MAVVFEFSVEKSFHFAAAFAEQLGVPAVADRVELPASLGDGFIQEVFLPGGLSLCIHQYVLKQALTLKRRAGGPSEVLTIKFDCQQTPAKPGTVATEILFRNSKGCEVELGTANFFTEILLPPGRAILFLVVGTSRATLCSLVDSGLGETPIADMIQATKSFVLHERMTLEMERTLKQIAALAPASPLAHMLYEAKTRELIYLLFLKLLARDTESPVAVNEEDAATIYRIRAEMLEDLSIAPELPKLARKAGMSQSKLKGLFSQIFGKSVYNYYQAERMDEAAVLLQNLTVSETGYKVGFTNLSHFTKLFEKHHGAKPKKYKDALKATGLGWKEAGVYG